VPKSVKPLISLAIFFSICNAKDVKKFFLFYIAFLTIFFVLGPQVNFSFAAGVGEKCSTDSIDKPAGNCVGNNVECNPDPGQGLACAEHGHCPLGTCKVIGSCKTTDKNDILGTCALGNFCDTGNDHSDACTTGGQCNNGTCQPNDNGGPCKNVANSPNGTCDGNSVCDTSQDPSNPIGVCATTNNNPQLPPCATAGQVPCLAFQTSLGTIPTNAGGFIKSTFGVLLAASGGIALLLIMRAGYKIMTSQGNPEAIKEGRDRLIAAIVGLLFLIFALVFLQLIGVDILRIPGFQ